MPLASPFHGRHRRLGMTRRMRLAVALLALALTLVAASPAAAGRGGGMNGLKFSIELLIS
jgi:hypothetical protein